MNDIQSYIKELQQLKSLGILDKDQNEEIDNLIKVVGNLENQNDSFNVEEPDVHKLQIKFVNTSDNPDPIWAKEGDSGFDLRACLPKGEKEVILRPFERMLIPTGLYFELPMGYDIDIKSRSGLAVKNGIMVLTGTIDQNYRGEVKVLLYNTSNEDFIINHSDRIAQGVIRFVVTNSFGVLQKVDTLNNSNRMSDGFGSTGVK